MNKDIISVGDDYRDWPRSMWGTEDHAKDAALKEQSRRLRGLEPLTDPEPMAGIPGGLYGVDKSAERRRRAVDEVLVKAGIKPRRW